MREILYRGQRLADGKWIYGYYFEQEMHDGLRSYIRTSQTDRFGSDFSVDPDTVGQYTGRMDVDDDKIFEGDVLTVSIFDHNGLDTMYTVVVKWAEEYAQFMCVDVNDKDCMWDLGLIILNDGEPLIIGNRWDNLSLLKGGKK